MTALTNKVAIVTGASSGIGYATAKLFAREGAKVLVTARRALELDALVVEITRAGGTAVALAGDVGDETHARASVELATTRFGGLDVAFNNAGTLGAGGPTPEIGLEAWEDTMRTNLTSAFLGAKYQIPALCARGRGSLIFTSAVVGHTVGFAGTAAYAASKAGVIGLVRALATELGPKGVRVNALVPGGTDTPMGHAFASTPEALAFTRRLHALERLASPDEIAHAALYLASDASSFTTGTALLADGGVSIMRA